jgi:dihydrofolate synthase / folylpolyglutamate synthase
VDISVQKGSWQCEPRYTSKTIWGDFQLPLPGRRAAENVNLALKVFECLGFHSKGFLNYLSHLRWPGRMELAGLSKIGARIYLSGDHNPQGIESLVELLKDYEREHLYFIVGIGKDKSAPSMLEKLGEVPKSSIILTTTPFRGLHLAAYGDFAARAAAALENPVEALNFARSKASAQDLIVVTGSLYLVGCLRSAIKAS